MGRDLVHAGVRHVLGRRSPLSDRGITADELNVEQPHVIYDLRADEIANGDGLESAHQTGYRYLVKASSGPIAAGEVLTNERGEASLLAGLNYGRFVQATTDALVHLEALDQVRAHPYEVRLLRFSAVYLLAIWLRSQSSEPDMIFPLPPAPPPLEAERPYSPEEFLAAIVPLAQNRVAGRDSPTVP